MGKYIVTYHASVSAMEWMSNATPKDMEAWMAWAQRCGEGLVDMGTPLGGGIRISESGSSPSERGVVAYSILQADDMEGALALLQGHPHIGWMEGCEIEVHESLAM